MLGYTCLNDVSARDIQFGDGQWVRGKSLDTFCPMGPVLVTADEIPDPQRLAIRCRVGDAIVQDASTAQMYFGVAAIVSYCSRSFRLEPGDVIATGTPGGVGIFRDPPALLGDGDEVTVEIEGIGRLDERLPLRAGGGSGLMAGAADERFLVTGALGCIGAWTVRALVRQGVPVVAFDLGQRPPKAAPDHDATTSLPQVTFVHGDITDLASIEAALDDQRDQQRHPPGRAPGSVLPGRSASRRARQRGRHGQRLRGGQAPSRSGWPRSCTRARSGCTGPTTPTPATGRLAEQATAHPLNHYGVYKLANEGNGPGLLARRRPVQHRAATDDRLRRRAATRG